VQGARALVLGIAFKENCTDISNSRVVDIVKELADYGCKVDVYDPCELSYICFLRSKPTSRRSVLERSPMILLMGTGSFRTNVGMASI
jgi:UDP-N-acetyl-D-mannosaminuronate dehydrogenase